jgi:hypothetical protein
MGILNCLGLCQESTPFTLSFQCSMKVHPHYGPPPLRSGKAERRKASNVLASKRGPLPYPCKPLAFLPITALSIDKSLRFGWTLRAQSRGGLQLPRHTSSKRATGQSTSLARLALVIHFEGLRGMLECAVAIFLFILDTGR